MEEENYIIKCPHCEDNVIIHKNEINCGIFRHAVYKKTIEQINPHCPREECERLLENGEVFGCTKPFRVVIINGTPEVSICDYI
jgi:hypothetical protein